MSLIAFCVLLAICPPAIIMPRFIRPCVSNDSFILISLVIRSKSTSAVVSVTPPASWAPVMPVGLNAVETMLVRSDGFLDSTFSTAIPRGPETYAAKPPYINPPMNFSFISATACGVNPASLVAAFIADNAAGIEPMPTVIPAFILCCAAFLPYFKAAFFTAPFTTEEPGARMVVAITMPISVYAACVFALSTKFCAIVLASFFPITFSHALLKSD